MCGEGSLFRISTVQWYRCRGSCRYFVGRAPVRLKDIRVVVVVMVEVVVMVMVG